MILSFQELSFQTLTDTREAVENTNYYVFDYAVEKQGPIRKPLAVAFNKKDHVSSKCESIILKYDAPPVKIRKTQYGFGVSTADGKIHTYRVSLDFVRPYCWLYFFLIILL